MRRRACAPRTGWQDRVEQAGLTWHTLEQPYWNESAFYEFSAAGIEVLERATNELAAMSLEAAQHIIRNKLYARMGIPPCAIPLIEHSWELEPPSLYGRFDLSWDGVNPPKLLEYNADTPTSLLEASVVQWQWLEDVFPACDQFNSIHTRLIALWKQLCPCLPARAIDFCSMEDAEDEATITYLMDTAQQAGLSCSSFHIGDIGWDGARFVRPDGRPLRAVFKLYPWEWMVHEEFAQYLPGNRTIWIEPPWKMLLSNKGILPVLWEIYPGHPNLLEAFFEGPGPMAEWVRKPLLGREGCNVTIHSAIGHEETEGDYGEEGFVYQALHPGIASMISSQS